MGKNKVYQRSKNYRKNYFENNSGIFGSNKYQCVYCGKILPKEKIQIDHFMPVNKVKHFGFGRLYMRIKNINNINSIKNLVPACPKCNQRKSDKISLNWFLKGLFGKHKLFWLIVWIIRLIILIGIGILIYYLYTGKIDTLFSFLQNTYLQSK